jgi:RNA polymerase sigma-70 factor (ECF subfamily)
MHDGAPPPVDALVQSVRSGDEHAASALLDRLYPLVLKIVRCHLPPRTSEEDLCQMIFVRIFRRLHLYSGLAPLEHWVSRLAVNVCLNQIEKERIRPELRFADLNEDEGKMVEYLASTPAEIPEEQSEIARVVVAKLLLKLDPKDRLIITMLHLEEKIISEIRVLTGWSTVTIKVRAYRARIKLKRAYGYLLKHDP